MLHLCMRMLLAFVTLLALCDKVHGQTTTTGGSPAGGSGAGNAAESVFAPCYAAVQKKCKNDIAFFAVTDYWAPQKVMTCVTNQRASMPPICQEMVDRLNKDELGINLLTCGKNVFKLCSTEMLAAVPTQSSNTNTADAEATKTVIRCFNKKSSQMSQGCQDLVQQNFETAQGFQKLVAAEKDDCDPGEPGCQEVEVKADGGGGGAATAAAVVLAILLCGTCGGLLFFYRKLHEAEEKAGVNTSAAVELADPELAEEERQRLAPPVLAEPEDEQQTVSPTTPPHYK